ncbi:uncharacterized protein LY89DRAFT_726203 [Mollisia scopiformis]|uniref:Zn(2)-C6 fungal-type domain-containing protein n=1 Tax=Mollisia scopiformis TaxID=149040 RepID=A0A132B441_MOLSC|nr:uncharacterized protein LY89DRAFT_726203 [Mollisia scopiformis]KUJ06789.1 hypothetical protein LY89DRAFT_726203 [Mollisia scopiformis]
MTTRVRACDTCRKDRVKCDKAKPKCGHCQSRNLQCTSDPFHRRRNLSAPADQVWLNIATDLNFVEETPSLTTGYDYDSDSENEELSPQHTPKQTSDPHSTNQIAHEESLDSPSEASQSLKSHPPSTPRTIPPWDHSSPPAFEHHQYTSLPKLPGLPHHDFMQLPSPVSSTPRTVTNYETPSHIYHEDHNTFQENLRSISLPSIYLDKPVWPLTDPQEARLLRHFVQNLAIWLDLCDPAQHFQVEVPRRAGTCPILLNAIFALSARHLNLTGSYDSLASNRYHQECLKYLIPMLNNTATVSDETLFAATIILRVLEEIDLLETDLQSHMLGIQIFVKSLFHPINLHSSPISRHNSLATASFWIGLRQEIYMATLYHRSVQINLEHYVVDRTTSSTTDFGWANRAVVLCADVLNCCFGTEGVSLSKWEELKTACERWEDEKPSSFTPIFRRGVRTEKGTGGENNDREAFPEIWHSHACHIIGVQHLKLAQILLCIFDPRIPRVGGSRSVAVRNMEVPHQFITPLPRYFSLPFSMSFTVTQHSRCTSIIAHKRTQAQIKPTLRELCGIGLYNRWTPPGMFTASMGIALCGDRFEDRFDQEALLDILVRTERDHARPTATVQKQLKEAWGWVEE